MSSNRPNASTATSSTDIPVFDIVPSRGWLSINWRELWAYRELLFILIWRNIKIRYKQTVLGATWAVLQPVMTMVVFTIFLGQLIPKEKIPYPVLTFTALLPWQLFSYALSESGNSLVANQNLITKVYFPRLLIPISGVLSGLVDFAIAFVVLLVMMVCYGITPGIAILALPLLILLTIATALAVGLWLSALNVKYRDVRYITPFLLQFWFYATPIVFPANLLDAKWRILYALNPLVGVVEGFRWALLNTEYSGTLTLVSSVAVIVLLIGGLLYFRRMEDSFADVV